LHPTGAALPLKNMKTRKSRLAFVWRDFLIANLGKLPILQINIRRGELEYRLHLQLYLPMELSLRVDSGSFIVQRPRSTLRT
jgi:hypothetical protein